MTIEIRLNGETQQIPAPLSIVQLLDHFDLPKERRYVAVTDPIAAGFEPVESWFNTTAADVAHGQRLYAPFRERPRRFAFEVDDDEISAGVEHLAEMIIPVLADSNGLDMLIAHSAAPVARHGRSHSSCISWGATTGRASAPASPASLGTARRRRPSYTRSRRPLPSMLTIHRLSFPRSWWR